jgi:hypothetical protein
MTPTYVVPGPIRFAARTPQKKIFKITYKIRTKTTIKTKKKINRRTLQNKMPTRPIQKIRRNLSTECEVDKDKMKTIRR